MGTGWEQVTHNGPDVEQEKRLEIMCFAVYGDRGVTVVLDILLAISKRSFLSWRVCRTALEDEYISI